MRPSWKLAAASVVLIGAAAAGAAVMAGQSRPDAKFSFFITSAGSGKGADLGGLAGADAHCTALAKAVGSTKTWRAYLSTQGAGAVNARDRIGKGPWYNVNGVMVANDVAELHGAAPNLQKQTELTEKGTVVNGRGDTPNMHDILTGSTAEGTSVSGAEDRTCSNWTSGAETGSAVVGHFDRQGGGANPTSWNAAHNSSGCSQSKLVSTGGNGFFYCFATN